MRDQDTLRNCNILISFFIVILNLFHIFAHLYAVFPAQKHPYNLTAII